MHRRRPGFLFTMPLMLGMGILLFASMIAISHMFVHIGGPMIPDLLADMPTIFHYDERGQRIPEHIPLFDDLSQVSDAADSANTDATEQNFAELFPAIAMYGLMVKIAMGIFVILLMLAGISYFFEEFNIVRQGTAYEIVAKMIVLIPIYLVLPYMWDMTALVIESSSLYLMDPFGGNPHGRTAEMWCQLGSVTCNIDGTTSVDPIDVFGADDFDRDTVLSQETWNNSLQNPVFGEDLIINTLLSLFKGFAIMFMTAMMFVLSAIRILLVEVIVIAFPLISAIGLIPWINTKGVYEMFQQNLIGLSIAPILSAISLSIGLATIDAQNLPPLRMWFQLLSVGFLAIFFPVLLSPMLGNISTRVGTMLSTTITSASMAGSSGLRGATQGISRASSSLGLGRTSTSGIPPNSEGGQENGFSSLNVGTATSGANLAGSMSQMDKLKLYGKTGLVGMVGGLSSGLLQSSSQNLGMGGAFGGVSNQMMHAVNSRIDGIVDGGIANSIAVGATDRMMFVENSHIAENPVPSPHIVNKATMMNPGASLNSMIQNNRHLDTGIDVAEDPDKMSRFVKMYGESNGINNMSPQTQQKIQAQLTRKVSEHPIATGMMYDDLASSTGNGDAGQ